MRRVFELEYYLRNMLAEYMAAAVTKKLPWAAGIDVKMRVEADDSCRWAWQQGAVDSVVLAIDGSWALSLWRMLKVIKLTLLFNLVNLTHFICPFFGCH